ncbi:hypothetical protein [Phycicoccus flavus]|uniref:hypothetical protein n=1 Tax=Phycicoccus flavus TaxID=2502783 RepID=UPI000FEBCEF3|nr:hypothetical protein [Phycicoccus flavus]NHA69528.1 hypothetical protein [Phycicoccus flavus]
MSLVPGDPGSLSACAATAASVGATLAARGQALTESLAGLGDGWPGRRSVETRRRADGVADATATTAAELARVSTVLQDHATALADLLAQARAVQERAERAGLEVRDGRVRPALGVLAEADASATRERDEAAARLQSDLDGVLARARRQRDFALEVLRGSTTRLAGVSTDLRR